MAEAKVIVIPEGKICDYVDGKFRNDTPEEYVRQTIEKRLVNEHKYAIKQIKIEYTLQLGSNKPRADIVIFDKNIPLTEQTQNNVKLIIECKKEAVDARNAKDGVEQLKSYMSACPNCEWGMWTNGKQKEVFRKYVDDHGNITFMEYNDIPSADGNLDTINRPQRQSLKNAYDDNLLFVFKTCHNHIHVNDGLQKQPAFFELLKVIFCKIEDERNIPNPLDFYTTSAERSNPDGQLTVKKRISKIFERVKKKHGKIFDANDEIKLSPRSLAYIVSELQKYSLLNTDIDIKGKAYEEIVGANLRGDRGEFFTPRNVMKMVVEMINPKLDERVLDSSCGTGGFLVTAMTHVIDSLEKQFAESLGKPRNDWNNDEIKAFQDRISEMASTNFFGFDINPDLVKATKMNNPKICSELFVEKINELRDLLITDFIKGYSIFDIEFLSSFCGLNYFNKITRTKEQREVSKKLISVLPVGQIAKYVEYSKPRDWQGLYDLLRLLIVSKSVKLKEVVNIIDYNILNKGTAKYWQKTDNRLHLLFAFIAYGNIEKARVFFNTNKDKIEELDLPFIKFLPQESIDLFSKGVKIILFEQGWCDETLLAIKSLELYSTNVTEKILYSTIEQSILWIEEISYLTFDSNSALKLLEYFSTDYTKFFSDLCQRINIEKLFISATRFINDSRTTEKEIKRFRKFIDLIASHSSESNVESLKRLKYMKNKRKLK